MQFLLLTAELAGRLEKPDTNYIAMRLEALNTIEGNPFGARSGYFAHPHPDVQVQSSHTALGHPVTGRLGYLIFGHEIHYHKSLLRFYTEIKVDLFLSCFSGTRLAKPSGTIQPFLDSLNFTGD